MIIGYLSKIKIKDLLVLDLLNDWIPVHEMRLSLIHISEPTRR